MKLCECNCGNEVRLDKHRFIYRHSWCKNLKGDEYKKHFPNGMGGQFKKGDLPWNTNTKGVMKSKYKGLSAKTYSKFKKLSEKNCLNCLKIIEIDNLQPSKKYCSHFCNQRYNVLQRRIKKLIITNKDDYVQCLVCKIYFHQISGRHVKIHRMKDIKQYLECFPFAPLMSANASKKRSEIIQIKNPVPKGSTRPSYIGEIVRKKQKGKIIPRDIVLKGIRRGTNHHSYKYGSQRKEKVNCVICKKDYYKTRHCIKLGTNNVCSGKCRGIFVIQTYPRKTSIEEKVEIELQKMNLEYIYQFNFKNTWVSDFCLPKYNIIIECDGDYWHSSKQVKGKDKYKDEMYRRAGFKVLRFSETVINKNIDEVIIKIKESCIPTIA
ncbi:MAG: DUF559 domain-containing protein [bacterium]|nr:DUF559 domain-containing protein [bacterium]